MHIVTWEAIKIQCLNKKLMEQIIENTKGEKEGKTIIITIII